VLPPAGLADGLRHHWLPSRGRQLPARDRTKPEPAPGTEVVVREGGFEPPRVAPPEPKSGASANFATLPRTARLEGPKVGRGAGWLLVARSSGGPPRAPRGDAKEAPSIAQGAAAPGGPGTCAGRRRPRPAEVRVPCVALRGRESPDLPRSRPSP